MLLEFFGQSGIIASSGAAIVVAAAVATAVCSPPTFCKNEEARQMDTERVARPYSPEDRNDLWNSKVSLTSAMALCHHRDPTYTAGLIAIM